MEAPEAIMENCGTLLSVERVLRTRNNHQEAVKQFEKYGEWWEWIFEYVPIEKINVKPVWNRLRFEDNLKKLKATGKMPPIRLCFYDETGKYEIDDGVHRTAAAQSLGYVKVPAIAAYKRTYRP